MGSAGVVLKTSNHVMKDTCVTGSTLTKYGCGVKFLFLCLPFIFNQLMMLWYDLIRLFKNRKGKFKKMCCGFIGNSANFPQNADSGNCKCPLFNFYLS